MKLNQAHQTKLLSQIEIYKATTEQKIQDLKDWNKIQSFLSANLFDYSEKAQDLLWISFIELENEHLKRMEQVYRIDKFLKAKSMSSIEEKLDFLKKTSKDLDGLGEFVADISNLFHILNIAEIQNVSENDCFTEPLSNKLIGFLQESKLIKGLLYSLIDSPGHNSIKELENGNKYSLSFSRIEKYSKSSRYLQSDFLNNF